VDPQATVRRLTPEARAFPRPSLPAVLALALGLATGHAAGVLSFAPAFIFLIAAIVAGSLARQWPRLLPVSFGLGFFAAGLALQTPLNRADAQADGVVSEFLHAPGGIVQLEGTLGRALRPGNESTLIWLESGARLSSAGVTRKLSVPVPVRIAGGAGELLQGETPLPGDRIVALGRMTPIEDAGRRDGFDRWLESQGADAIFSAQRFDIHAPESCSLPNAARASGQRIADALHRALLENLNPDQAAVAAAMMLGRSGGLDTEQREHFRRAGLMHLFAVSGLHAGIVALFLAGLFSVSGMSPRARAIAILCGLAAFCLITG